MPYRITDSIWLASTMPSGNPGMAKPAVVLREWHVLRPRPRKRWRGSSGRFGVAPSGHRCETGLSTSCHHGPSVLAQFRRAQVQTIVRDLGRTELTPYFARD